MNISKQLITPILQYIDYFLDDLYAGPETPPSNLLTIWCPFENDNDYISVFQEKGYNIVIPNKYDFYTQEPEKYDIIISAPKLEDIYTDNKLLKRATELHKPYVFLFPLKYLYYDLPLKYINNCQMIFFSNRNNIFYLCNNFLHYVNNIIFVKS